MMNKINNYNFPSYLPSPKGEGSRKASRIAGRERGSVQNLYQFEMYPLPSLPPGGKEHISGTDSFPPG